MRAAIILIAGLFLIIAMLLAAALQWARRQPGRKYPDGAQVWYHNRLRIVHAARYHRGRWWYNLEGVEWEVRQEEIV